MSNLQPWSVLPLSNVTLFKRAQESREDISRRWVLRCPLSYSPHVVFVVSAPVHHSARNPLLPFPIILSTGAVPLHPVGVLVLCHVPHVSRNIFFSLFWVREKAPLYPECAMVLWLMVYLLCVCVRYRICYTFVLVVYVPWLHETGVVSCTVK